MSQRLMYVAYTLTLGCVLALVPNLTAADEKDAKDAKTPAAPAESTTKPKAPDFSKFTYVNTVVGEIVKADSNSLTLRITWFVPQNANRPGLQQGGNYRNPHAANHGRPQNTKVKEEHHDYTLSFAPDTQIRMKTLPPKTDDKGKKVDYTTKELEELKGPWAIPGYSASSSDLTPGTIVEVSLIRDKSIPASKATDGDMQVKYAVILGKDPNPPKDVTTPKPAPKKN